MTMPKNDSDAQKAMEELNEFMKTRFGRHYIAAVAFGFNPNGPDEIPAQTKFGLLNVNDCPLMTGLSGLKLINQQISGMLGAPINAKADGEPKRYDPSMG